MVKRQTIGQYAAHMRDTLPMPGTDAMEHARHTLAAFRDSDDSDFIVIATSGVYTSGQTGFTWGDLRELVRRLEAVERHLAPDWSHVEA